MDLGEIVRSGGQVEIVDGIGSLLFVVNLIWTEEKHYLRREIQFVVAKTLFSGEEGISFIRLRQILHILFLMAKELR